MKIVMTRVDERLIHGQIINAWYTRNNISHILIVDEELVEDQFMTNVYKALTPLSPCRAIADRALSAFSAEYPRCAA